MPYADKEKQRAAQREFMRRRRAAWLTANGPCRQCGATDDLEVDHINPAEKVTHNVWSWSAARRAVELAKCQVLCADCHNAKTIAARRSTAPCGTTARYQRGCRCTECRAAHATNRRTHRAARPRVVRDERVATPRATHRPPKKSTTPRRAFLKRMEAVRQRYLAKYPEGAPKFAIKLESNRNRLSAALQNEDLTP